MADPTPSPDGLAEARARAERRSARAPRTLPPSRRQGAPEAGAAPPAAPPAPVRTPRPRVPTAPAPAPAAAAAPGIDLSGLADAPTVGLTARIRVPLDRRIVGLVRALQDEGVRTSKIELIEMLISELPEELTPAFRARVEAFRARAGRQR